MNDAAHKVCFTVLRNLSYSEGESLQKQLLRAMTDDVSLPGTVLFVEHKPVITCGRSGDGSNLLASREQLAGEGIEFHQAGRGGDVTYHGPGQWTVYPILRLDWYKRDLHGYLRLLEECVIRFLAKYAVNGERRKGLTGVWVNGKKVAAVGIAVSRWITWHGFAVNIDPDLTRFTKLMHPCGIKKEQGGVTSLAEITGFPYTVDEVLAALQQAIMDVLQVYTGRF